MDLPSATGLLLPTTDPLENVPKFISILPFAAIASWDGHHCQGRSGGDGWFSV